MTPVPLADFLAGSLLSLLLPVALLIALAVWYVVVIRRRFAGDPGDPSEADVPLTDASHATTGIPNAPEPKP
jgi:hypothetical protein